MQVLKILKENNIIIPFSLGKEYGFGAHGQCFELLDSKNKVIKFSILFENYKTSYIESYKNIELVLNFLIRNNTSPFVKVFEFKHLFSGNRTLFDKSKQKYICYYYIMEKCFNLSDDESKTFHSIISHEDKGIGYNKNFSIQKIEEMLDGMSIGLEFNKQKVLQFCKDLQKSPINHGDLHNRNVMINKDNDYLLVDFDQSKLLEK